MESVCGTPYSSLSLTPEPVLEEATRLLIERREQIIERLCQRRVCKDAIAQSGIGQFAEHRHLQHGHNLATFETQDSAPQNFLCLSIHNRLHKTTRFVYLKCS